MEYLIKSIDFGQGMGRDRTQSSVGKFVSIKT